MAKRKDEDSGAKDAARDEAPSAKAQDVPADDAKEPVTSEQINEQHAEAAAKEKQPKAKVKDGYSDAPVGAYEFGVASAPSPYDDAPHSKLEKAAREGEGGTKVRQRLAASEASTRTPALQRPVEERGLVVKSALKKLHALSPAELQALADLNAQVALGDTLPGERSVDNDCPGFNLSVDHQHGTPRVEQADEAKVEPSEPVHAYDVGTEKERQLATPDDA